MPGVLETIRQSHPSSLWMLRDTDVTVSGPPTPGGIDASSGLVFGEPSLVEIFSADGRVPPSGPQWADWSWNSNRDWVYKTTDPSPPNGFLALAPQQTVGPYGLKYDATVGSDNGLQLHTDTPYDTTNDSIFLFYVKKNLNTEGLRVGFTDAAFADLGTAVDLVTLTGTVTSISGNKVLTDTSKTFITDAYVKHVLTITGGAGAGQSQEIWANTATTMTPRFDWGGSPPTAGSTYRIDAFWPDTEQMQPIMLTLRGADITGTKGNFNLPSGALVAQIYVVLLDDSTQTVYFDEMQFLPQRARFVPLIAGTTREIRAVNTPYNYMPQILTRYPTLIGDLPGPYLARMDGNCAGTTEEIMEWAATKHFGDLFGAWTATGGPGSLADLGKAISRQETQWNQWEHQGWEIWGDHSGTNTAGIYTLGTTGIGQTKSSLWPYYPHVRLSTAWAAECHMLALRWLVDGGASWVPMSGLSLVQKVRRATGYWSKGLPGYENSEYVCRALGGTVSGDEDSDLNGHTFVGQINIKPWLTMADGDEFPYENP